MALAAAQQIMKTDRKPDPSLTLNFEIGMHFGEVLYGNISSRTHIDFAVMGQTVNIAARIESLYINVDRSIQYSHDLTDRLSEPTVPRTKGTIEVLRHEIQGNE